MQLIQEKIYNFIERANILLDKKDALFYGGDFITGEIHSPDVLFLGINPGFGDDWDRRKIIQKDFELRKCKYIEEFEDNYLLARRVVDVVCGGDLTKLNWCAESSIKSIFATPNEKSLDKALSQLTPKMRLEHDDLIREIIELIKPKHIICIGFIAFNKYLQQFGQSLTGQVNTKTCLTKSGKSRVYYKNAFINGIMVHGVLHLSGAQISAVALDGMREEFVAMFKTINANTNPFRRSGPYEKAKFFQKYLYLVDRCTKTLKQNLFNYEKSREIAISTLAALVEKYEDHENFAWSARQSIKAALINIEIDN